MKTLGASLLSHYAQEVTTLALLFKITRTDGEVFRFTSHDKELSYGGEAYSPVNAFSSTAFQTTAGMSVDNFDAEAIIDADSITESDLRAGLFRFAAFSVVEVNWQDTSMGGRIIRAGNLGEITVQKSGTWLSEGRGIMQPLQETYGRVYGPRCDAEFGDARCGFDASTRTQSGVVTAVASRGTFSVNGIGEDVFINGKVTWTSGLNNGLAMEIKNWTGSPSDTVELFDYMPFNIQEGDTFTMVAGCDKNPSTCRSEFNNIENFRGYEFLPGSDSVLQYPNSPA